MPVASANPHAPRVGRIRRLIGPFHVTGVFWYWLPNLAPRCFPRWAFNPAERFFGFAFYFFLVNIRRAVRANLRVVLGPCGFWEGQRRAARTLSDFACCYGDRYESLAFPERFRVTLEGEEHWQRARASGRGLIFVTAHIGAWEMSSFLAASDTAMRFHVVREEELDPRSQRFMQELITRRTSPNCITHFAAGDPRLGLELRDALEKGENVAVQGDRPRVGSRTVPASLFGRPFAFPAGPLMLARVAQAPLVPVFTFREKHYVYRTAFREPIHVSAEGAAGPALAAAAAQLAVHVEWAIRHRPNQWFAFGEIWPEAR
jgi:predicted LPLAT superfamily acyltransferase